MTGIGCGISRESHNGFVKFVMPIVGYMGAVTLHAIWNGMGFVVTNILIAVSCLSPISAELNAELQAITTTAATAAQHWTEPVNRPTLVKPSPTDQQMIGISAEMKELDADISRAARSSHVVLIIGEWLIQLARKWIKALLEKIKPAAMKAKMMRRVFIWPTKLMVTRSPARRA